MNDWTPGDGWREVTNPNIVTYPIGDKVYFHPENGHTHVFMREDPVPPLPTEPGSLIRVTWKNEATAKSWPPLLVLGLTHDWAWDSVGREGFIDVHDLPKWITGFEVLSEPRATTANRIAEFFNAEAATADATNWCNRAATTIRREFGVTDG